MTIRLEFTGESAELVLEDIQRVTGLVRAPVEPVAQSAPIPAEEPAPAPKKGRPKKAEPVAETTPEPAPEQEPVETVPEAEPVADVTLDNVKDAIRALMLKTDEDTTWGVLKSVGVKGASDAFNSGKGPKLIEKCQEKIAEVEAA